MTFWGEVCYNNRVKKAIEKKNRPCLKGLLIMKDTILELLPSRALKRKIREVGYEFSEAELLYILYEYAPTFDEKLTLLDAFAQTASPEIGESARLIAAWQRRIRDAFRICGAGEVYELHIKDTPESYDETYLCATVDAALAYIDLFYDEYDTTEKGDSTRYRIVKRRIYTGKSGETFDEDYVAECVLDQHKRLLTVDDHADRSPYGIGFCEGRDCDTCGKVCLTHHDWVLFPCFTGNEDLVKFTDDKGAMRYGINFQWDDSPADCLCVDPLDSLAVRYHSFENAGDDHEHPPLPLVELASIDELDKNMRKDYLAFMEYLKETEET